MPHSFNLTFAFFVSELFEKSSLVRFTQKIKFVLLIWTRRWIVDAVNATVQLWLVLFFPLHPAVLEPDLDLPLGEAKRVSNFYSPPSGQVSVKVELLLQLQGLVPGVWGPLPFCFTILIHCVWKVEKELTLEAVLFISRKKNRVVCPRVINGFIVTNELRSSIVSSFEGWATPFIKFQSLTDYP